MHQQTIKKMTLEITSGIFSDIDETHQQIAEKCIGNHIGERKPKDNNSPQRRYT